jgi:hypothetical protein
VARDDGAGGLFDATGPLAGCSINYTTGALILQPDRDVGVPSPSYSWAINDSRYVASSWPTDVFPALFPLAGVVTVSYRLAGTTPTANEVYTLNMVDLDLTLGFAEQIVQGSVDFTLGSSRYVSTAGKIYRDPSPGTGAGTLAGSLDPTTGIVRIENWTGGANTPVVTSLVTVIGMHPVDACLFRTPVANIRPGSLQLRATTWDGTVLIETIPSSGVLETNEMTVSVNYPDGVIDLRFGEWRTVASLTPTELLEDWYDAGHIVSIGGVDSIWKPLLVLADSILYNAVAQTTLPPDRAMIGIDASRLPPDGKALIFRRGALVLVHHTATVVESALSPTQVVDCNRVRLYRVVIEDVAGQRLPASFYTVDRELGLVTMAANLNLTGYTGPYTFYHTVADLCRITNIDISGRLSLNKAVSHDYPINATFDSYASGVLYVGTLQARYSNLFAQSTWTSVWSDTLIGSAPLAQYNDTLYPIIVSNLGVYPDRILLKLTSSTAFQCFGEGLGLIGTGDITADFAPVNQLTGQPYFTLDYRGWGAGWATGNCLRFNLIGANYPVDLIRAIQPSTPTGLDDSVELLFIGNVDA